MITKRDELFLTENAPAEVQVVGTRKRSKKIIRRNIVHQHLFIQEEVKILVQYLQRGMANASDEFFPV